MPLQPQCLIPVFHLPRPLIRYPHTFQFHTTSAQFAEIANHYETLGLDPTASAGAIKKQFYNLSKTHHPDLNPNDRTATTRFVAISEAYAVLGNPSKRATYDAERAPAHVSTHSSRPRGSHSSSSTPFGSRPAGGLSRRRTHFKGPPPSFYRSGGWGTQSEKRKAHAQQQTAGAAAEEARGGGMGYGQGQAGWNDVPHFDREGHYRTQEQEDIRRQRRMRQENGLGEFAEGGSLLAKFVLICGVVGFAVWIPGVVEGLMMGQRGRPRGKTDDG